MMNCPNCIEKMSSSRNGDVNVHTCLYCNWSWFDGEGMSDKLAGRSNIDKEKEQASQVDDQGTKHACPVCNDSLLQTDTIDDVKVEICPHCDGVFVAEDGAKKIVPKQLLISIIKRHKWVWIGLIILILWWPPVYFILPLEATVVDRETGEPIEGAIVVWHWELHTTNLHESHIPYKTIVVGETVTNDRGRFRMTAWPRLHFPPLITWLSSNQPRIEVFKPGYEPTGARDSVFADTALYLFRRSTWHEQEIKLIKRDRYSAVYAKQVRSLDSSLSFLRYGDNCEWQKAPKILVTVHKENKFFEAHSINVNRGLSHSIYDVHESWGCQSAEEFFKDYL